MGLIGLDATIFVYALEANPTFGPAARHLLAQIETGRLRAVFSIVGKIEVLTGPKRRGDVDLTKRFRRFIHELQNSTIIEVYDEISEVASDLRGKYGLRTPDAIHLGTAIAAGAERFITNDRRLKRVTEIRVELLSAWKGR